MTYFSFHVYNSFFLCRCTKLDDLKRKLDNLRHELDNPTIFKDIYRYSYDFAKVCDNMSKGWVFNNLL